MKGEVYASDASHLWRVPLRNDECNCERVQYNRNMHTCCCAYKLSSLRARVYDRVILLSYPLHTIAFISSYFTSAEHTHTGTRTRVPHTYSCAPERPPSLSLLCLTHALTWFTTTWSVAGKMVWVQFITSPLFHLSSSHSDLSLWFISPHTSSQSHIYRRRYTLFPHMLCQRAVSSCAV